MAEAFLDIALRERAFGHMSAPGTLPEPQLGPRRQPESVVISHRPNCTTV